MELRKRISRPVLRLPSRILLHHLCVQQLRIKRLCSQNACVMDREHLYAALDQERDQIRLLHLNKPRSAANNAALALTGRLATMSLLEAPRYNALSYVWGSPTIVSSVCLDDGSCIPIAANLLDALSHVATIDSVLLH